jgi:hypothetical protein
MAQVLQPNLLPRTTPEQRSRFYEDIESLLNVGFLSHNVNIQNIPLSVRSLGPGDFFLLQARVNDKGPLDWQVWVIASSVWMINGYSLIGEPQAVPIIAKMIKEFPKSVKDVLFSIIVGLFTRQTKALKGVEAYCYEGVSRFKWKSYGRGNPKEHSGIPGIESLGTNYVQRMWSFYNEVEDQRIVDESMWEGFKLSASAMSPKGVQKIDAKDRQHRVDEDKRRQTVQDKFYYMCLGVLSDDEKTTTKNNVTLLNPHKSVEDLEQEMHMWVTGQEDWHDKIVNDYKRQISERYMKDKAEREERAEQLRKQKEDNADMPSTVLVGYTPEQLQAIIGNKQPGIKQVYDDPYGGVREYLYKRHLEKAPGSGLLKSTDEGRVDVKGGTDLTEQVANRQVSFKSVKGE